MRGRTLSEEHKRAISAGLRATDLTAANKKRSAALVGKPKTPEHVEKVRMAIIGQKRTLEQRLKMSLAHRGKKLSAEHIKAAALAHIGLKRSPEWCAQLSKRMRENPPMRGRFGENHPNWIADRSKLKTARSSRSGAHFAWSRSVRRRFKNCVLMNSEYGECSGRLEAHHIHDFISNPEKRYDADNGISLCRKHHPHKLTEVNKLAPIFKAMVVNWKESN